MESNYSDISRKKDSLLFGMELLRGLSAIAVLLLHYQHFYYISPLIKSSDVDRVNQPFWELLRPLYEHGALGVQVFWVVSGVVLSSVYMNAQSTKYFFLNRFSRIYPLHVLTLLILVVFQTVSLMQFGHSQIYDNNNFSNFFLHISFLVGFRNDTNYGFNGVIWSVSVEIALYVVFFFFLKTTRFRLASALFGFIGFSFLDRLYPWLQVLECGKYFFLGVYLYLLKQLSSKLLLAFGITFFVLQLYFSDQRVFLLIGALVSVVLFSELVIRSLPNFILRVIKNLGAISYSLYLVHIPLQVGLLIVFSYYEWNQKLIANDPRFFFLYFLFLLLLSLVIHKMIELPIRDRLRVKFSAGNSSR